MLKNEILHDKFASGLGCQILVVSTFRELMDGILNIRIENENLYAAYCGCVEWKGSVWGVKRMFTFVRVGGQVWSEHYEENVFLYTRLCYLDVSHSGPFWKLVIIPEPQEVCCRSKLLPSFLLTRYP